MACWPALKLVVEKDTGPDVSAPKPITVPLSRNCTVPLLAAAGAMTAVNVTAWPAVEGFALDVTRIADLFCMTRLVAGEVV